MCGVCVLCVCVCVCCVCVVYMCTCVHARMYVYMCVCMDICIMRSMGLLPLSMGSLISDFAWLTPAVFLWVQSAEDAHGAERIKAGENSLLYFCLKAVGKGERRAQVEGLGYS